MLRVSFVSLTGAVRSENYAQICEETQGDACVLELLYEWNVQMSAGWLVLKQRNVLGQHSLNTLGMYKYWGSLGQKVLLSKGLVAAEQPGSMGNKLPEKNGLVHALATLMQANHS